MKRWSLLALLSGFMVCGCNIYHYSTPIPGENVVFNDNTTISGGNDSPVSANTSGNVAEASAGEGVEASGESYEPGPLTQEIDVAKAQAESTDEVNGAPSWIGKQAFDEIDRGRQVFYGVGFSYYQAPTKKELDKARAKAEQSATDKLTNYVLSNSSNVTAPLEGVSVVESWQDLEQMALYTLVRYVNK